MRFLSWLSSFFWPEPRYRSQVPPSKPRGWACPPSGMYQPLTEGKQVSGGIRRALYDLGVHLPVNKGQQRQKAVRLKKAMAYSRKRGIL